MAFISVYREMFETILIYQALWTQVTEATQPYLLYGLLAALAALAVVCVLIFRLGMRLPLGLFFKATSLVLLVLSVILLGKGIAALQERVINATYIGRTLRDGSSHLQGALTRPPWSWRWLAAR